MNIDIDMKKAGEFLAEKRRQRVAHLDERYQLATQHFQRITEHIINNYNPQRIWQWGSLLNRKHFSEISDIDIALEGIDSIETYAAILADAAQMTTFPLDVVEMERIGVAHADHIRTYGRMVYERPRH